MSASMVILVCGGRNFADKRRLTSALDLLCAGTRPKRIIHGGAKGADRLADEYARNRGFDVVEYAADWNTYGRSAGVRRNAQMLEEGKPEIAVAFAGGKGTSDMVRRAVAAGIMVFRIE